MQVVSELAICFENTIDRKTQDYDLVVRDLEMHARSIVGKENWKESPVTGSL